MSTYRGSQGTFSPYGVPYHWTVGTWNYNFTLTVASGQLNASTTCLLERSTYAEAPILTQGIDSFTLPGGDLAGQGDAGVTCYSLVSNCMMADA